jgi:hypothetical protein
VTPIGSPSAVLAMVSRRRRASGTSGASRIQRLVPSVVRSIMDQSMPSAPVAVRVLSGSVTQVSVTRSKSASAPSINRRSSGDIR